MLVQQAGVEGGTSSCYPDPVAPSYQEQGGSRARAGEALEHHVELGDQEVDAVTVLGLEGLSDDAGSFTVLLAPQWHPVHLQNYVAHLELPTVVG